MKRTRSLALLSAAALLLFLTHLELQSADDQWMLAIDGRTLDISGVLDDARNKLLRDCTRVAPLSKSEPLYQQALQVIRDYSPPDSASAQLIDLIAMDDWMLAQVHFSELQSVVLVLQVSAGALDIPEGGVWSGSTHPHEADPFIRRYLKQRLPNLPDKLLSCLQTRNWNAQAAPERRRAAGAGRA